MHLVTAFITAYNEEDRIANAVESLLGQTLRDIEVLVIDDGSTDRTRDVLDGLADDRLRVIPCGRIGRAAALARVTCEARGTYVANLDADDQAFPERLAEQARFLDAHPEVAWVGGGERRVDEQRSEQYDRTYPETDRAIRAQACRFIPYCHSAVMFRKAVVDRGINYDPKQPFLIDFEFFIRVAARYQVANLPDMLVRRTVRKDSFFQGRMSVGRMNAHLARLGARAVREFDLPVWYYAFPLARLCYPWLPNPAKRLARRLQGLKERAAEPTL